ncbi:helix-turn-helix transcriptional regulator [Lysinibacillus xylanilyticus]|nr:helix-turn-helix transcriptional regulator [Lysinibacillus xylanilyticus]MEB2281607.1 helix-turn-helix transcriptional regulator [Lysinibacillus xylanilyticus]
MNLSQNLKNKREEHSFSQEDIAQKLNVSRQSVSKLIITKTCG